MSRSDSPGDSASNTPGPHQADGVLVLAVVPHLAPHGGSPNPKPNATEEHNPAPPCAFSVSPIVRPTRPGSPHAARGSAMRHHRTRPRRRSTLSSSRTLLRIIRSWLERIRISMAAMMSAGSSCGSLSPGSSPRASTGTRCHRARSRVQGYVATSEDRKFPAARRADSPPSSDPAGGVSRPWALARAAWPAALVQILREFATV